MFNLVEYLQSKDMVLKFSGTQAYTHCVFCDEDKSKRGRLYINIDPESDRFGVWFCHLCHAKGGLNSLREFFGDPPLDTKPSYKMCHLFNQAAQYYANCLLENPEAYTYLRVERGFSDDTIERLQFGWADGGVLKFLTDKGWDIEDIKESGLVNKYGFDFLQDKITIPYVEMGNVTTIRGKQIGGKYLSLPGSVAQLYGMDSIRGEETVVLCAGEADAALMQQMGFCAAGVPGENIWKREWTDLLDEAKRVFIVFDNDPAGRAGAEKVAKTLGPRSRIVSMPEATPGQKKIDVTEWVVNHNKTKESFDWLFAKAKGGLLVSPAQAMDNWLEVEGNPNRVGLRFNVEELDSQMNHGLTPGQVVILVGKTNSSKSLSTFNLMHRMKMLKPDIKILLLSLEQTSSEWMERAHRIHNFYEPGSSITDTVHFWKDNLFLVEKNRVSLDELEVAVDQFRYETGSEPDLVVIDYLGYFARSFGSDEYSRLSDAIMALKGIAKEHKFVFLVPHQANRQTGFAEQLRLDNMRGSGVIEETADMVLSIFSTDQTPGIDKSEEKREIHMTILKSRDGGINGKVIFQFAPLTLALVPRSDPLVERAIKEKQYAWAGDTWRQAVERHKTGDKSVSLSTEEDVDV